LALASDFNDFEDGLQYFIAMDNESDIIITRNKKDFKNAKIPRNDHPILNLCISSMLKSVKQSIWYEIIKRRNSLSISSIARLLIE